VGGGGGGERADCRCLVSINPAPSRRVRSLPSGHCRFTMTPASALSLTGEVAGCGRLEARRAGRSWDLQASRSVVPQLVVEWSSDVRTALRSSYPLGYVVVLAFRKSTRWPALRNCIFSDVLAVSF